MDKQELLATIAVAERELSEAEGELEKAISEISVAIRAEKTTVTSRIEDAFTKLRGAKKTLSELQGLLASGED